MKYTVNYTSLLNCRGFARTFEDAREAAEYIAETCNNDYFDDMLNECYPMVNICGYDYDPAHALALVDPVAYRCARGDWEDSAANDLEEELEDLEEGGELEAYGFTVTAEEVEG